jgi:hypothetical protein
VHLLQFLSAIDKMTYACKIGLVPLALTIATIFLA